jgi:hypothetical protein
MFTRFHLDLTFMLSRPYLLHLRKRGVTIPSFWGIPTRLLLKTTDTLPRRRVQVQCALEIHHHSSGSEDHGLLFLRELRVIMLSRTDINLTEAISIMHFLDEILVRPLVREYNDPNRDRKVNLSLLADRAVVVQDGNHALVFHS